ncbi:MAG: ubiquinol oxidase subunit II [Marinobacter sp.]
MSFPRLRYGLALLPLTLLGGCGMVVMDPSGDIASQQADLIIVSTLLMLIVIVPVIFLTFYFAWRYRKNNKTAAYHPEWDHSTKLELVIWGVPLLIIIALGLITWISTHKLDPYRPLDRIDADRPLAADHEPLNVQVVSLDWKWLFIYPEQGVASINELVTPVDVPVRFHITSSSTMNSFYIPALAGQIYSMPGMQTTLNAVINEPGEYQGFSANYSGAGFSDMRFKYLGVSDDKFDAWVQKAKKQGGTLNRSEYLQLAQPSTATPVTYYSTVAPDLYHAILNRCVVEGKMCMDQMMMMGKGDGEMAGGAIKHGDKQKGGHSSALNMNSDDMARKQTNGQDDE